YVRLYVEDIPGRNIVLNVIDSNMSRGTLSGDVTYEYNDLGSDKFRKCILLKTQNLYDTGLHYDTNLVYDYPVVESVGYYTWDSIDVGYTTNTKISLQAEVYTDGTDATYTIEERHSTNGIDWTDWAEVDEYQVMEFRYIQFRVKLQTSNPYQNVRLFSFSVILDLPDIIERHKNIDVPDTGLDFTFTKTFHTDNLTVVATPTDCNYVAKVSNISRTGCTINLYTFIEEDGDDLTPTTGTAVSGKVNLLISGW
ncbi:MAG: hypothetical protein ACTSPI_11735, partial [Candidatus Heimdallarchaeaceae archaeon]